MTTTAVELKYVALLEKHNLAYEALPAPLKEKIGLLKGTKTRYEKNPTDKLRQSLEAFDLQVCNQIQDIVETNLEPEPTPAPTPVPPPAATKPEPDPVPTPAPEPPAPIKTADEENEASVLESIKKDGYIVYADLKKIIGTEPTDPYQKVGGTTLRRQLHGRYYIYK